MTLKVATWNTEYSGKLVGSSPSTDILDRRQRIRDTIQDINPDILCIEEGPKGERAIDEFCTQVLNRHWVPALLKQPGEALGAHDADYGISGDQWIWFLVRAGLEAQCKLQSPAVWRTLIGAKTWPVYLWGEEKVTRHSHYRHPQVLLWDLGNGQELEFVGVHLKSKINKKHVTRDDEDNLTGEYLKEALRTRVFLATEARDIRQYVDKRVDQAPQRGIVLMGDCNDGPGHDFFETRYLFFDLIGNLEGDVVMAERFFNHALFDFPAAQRWSARYADDVLKVPASQNPLLLDHILISQSLCRGLLPLMANPYAGCVEHQAYEQHNEGATNATRTSDHRPISCKFDDKA